MCVSVCVCGLVGLEGAGGMGGGTHFCGPFVALPCKSPQYNAAIKAPLLRVAAEG